MKKLLLIFSFLTLLISSTWAVDCMVEDTEHKIGTNQSFTYGPMTYGTTKMSIDIRKSNGGLGTVYIETSPDNSSYTQRSALQYSELGVSYHTYTFDTSTSDRYVRMRVSGGTLSKWYANLKSIEVFNLSTTSIDFGNVLVGQSSQQTFTIKWQQRGGAITSNNGKFTLSDSSFGSTDCGANGSKTVTVTFKPTAIGAQNGTINVDGAEITVTGVGTIPAPTGLVNTDLKNTSASFSWNAVSGATGYRLINKTTGATVDASGTSATMTGLTADTNYNFAVVAMSGSTPSSESNVVNVTTLFYDPTRCIFQHIAGPIDYKKGESYIVEFETSTTSPFKISVAYELSNPEGITASGDNTWIKYAKNGQTQSTHFNETQIKKIPTDSYKKYEETIMDDHVTGFKFESDNKNKYCRLKNLVVYYNTGLTSTNTTDGVFDFGTVAANSKTTKYITVDYANASGENLRVTDLTGTGFTVGDFGTIGSCQVGTVQIPVTYDATHGFGLKQAVLTLNNGQTLNIALKATVALAPPTNVKVADKTNTSITISWDKIAGATGYRIKMGGNTVDVSGENTTSYTWTGLNPDTDYTFTVMTLRTESGSTSVSTESDPVTGHTLFYDPSRCVVLADAAQYSFTSGGEKDYYFFNIPGWKVSPFPLEAHFELLKEDGVAGWQSVTVNSWDNTTGEWTDGIKEIDADDVNIYSWKQWDCTVPANSKAIQFETGANKHFYVKNVVVYYTAGLSADVTSVDFGTVATGSVTTKQFTVTYANATPLTATVTGDGFAAVETISETVGCGVGTITFKVKFTADAAWEGLTKSGNINFSNGATLDIPLTAIVKMNKVQNFAVTSSTTNSVSLSWTENAYAEKYEITTGGVTKTVTAPASAFEFPELASNTSYEFSIVAVRGEQKSEAATVTGKTLMVGPSNVQAATEGSSITLSWDPVEGADGYKIKNKTTGEVITILPSQVPYTISPIEPGKDYEFEIITMKDGQEQGSTSKNVTLPSLPSVNNFEITDITRDGAKFTWDAVTGTTGYKLINKNTGEKQTIIAPTTETTISGLVAGTEYEFELITMYNDKEQGSVSKSFTTKQGGTAEVGGVTYKTIQEAIDNAHGEEITILKDTLENITINDNVILNGDDHNINNIIITYDGSLEISGNLTVNDFILKSVCETPGEHYHSGQYYGGTKQLNLIGNAYIDITLDPSGTGSDNKWYSFTVPFPVDSRNGVYKMVGDVAVPGVWGSTYLILEYDAVKRATYPETGEKGWVYANNTLTPGMFYMIGTDGTNTFRFKKTSGSALVTSETSYTLKAYPSSEAVDANWNALGNNALYYVNTNTLMPNTKVQVYVNGDGEGANGRYETELLSEIDFNVAAPFFVQYADAMGSTLTLTRVTGTKSAVETMTSEFDVRIAAKGADDYADRLFVSASSEAKNEYELGFDVAKLGDLDKSASAMLWVKAYNINLAACRAPLSGASADFDLNIYAPADGVYNISIANEVSDATLYLTKNGEIIADMADSYALSLKKGTTDVYGLRIVVDDITTDIATDITTDIITDIETRTKEVAAESAKKPFIYFDNERKERLINANGIIYNLQGNLIK